MKALLLNHKTISALLFGILFGLAKGAILIFIATRENSLLTLALLVAVAISLGLLMGYTLSNRLKDAYFIAVASMLFLHAVSGLFAVLSLNIIYVSVIGIVSVGLLWACDALFNRLLIRRRFKVLIVLISYPILLLSCAVIGFYFVRSLPY